MALAHLFCRLSRTPRATSTVLLVLFAILEFFPYRAATWVFADELAGVEESASRTSLLDEVPNTQDPADAPPSPEESLAKITVPEGFQVTLFAAEPDVRQPIAMVFDDRGRLWVVEAYSYTDGHFRETLRDRVIILSDTDQDGQFDQRKVFWNQGRRLTGIALGFGGVWLTSAPELIFVPDRNGDDVPDGPPQVLLDGFDTETIGHNAVNGLLWGPDGWLYGRHGIQATSVVGPPGTPPEQRQSLNCSIWRYHPTRHTFDVVTHGTTNPWGLDYDDFGEFFLTNNVIGHLFHVVPGARFQRMYGQDFNEHAYELMDMCADHYHWDTSVAWNKAREGDNLRPELGGGHAHCGGMIYLGDNFPDEYRNCMFLCNVHGKRVNRDVLVSHQSGYRATHADDFFLAHDTWFRGIDLIYGPDGAVYISDWSDLGECHDTDGVHRTSGRIYKVWYGELQKSFLDKAKDLTQLSDEDLVQLLTHRNDWYVRQARRLLQERAAAGELAASTTASLQRLFTDATPTTDRLRALWALYVTDAGDERWLQQQLRDSDSQVRRWAIRLLGDRQSYSDSSVAALETLAASETKPRVHAALASALQHIPIEDRQRVAVPLVSKLDPADRNLTLLAWYGIEPLVAAQPNTAVRMIREAKAPQLRQFIARRLATATSP
ncbi:MAG: HEAT repeat domain-containing protein [Planctomycetales bacterium]|nr:HEAT repeat domain-containing protein [Planctomycetales bacterium]